MRAVFRLSSFPFVCTLALALAACGATTVDNSTTLASLSASGKGGVVLRLDMADCSGGSLVVGTKSGDSFQYAATIKQDDSYRSPGVAHVELDPGEYHVVLVTCVSGHTVNMLGEGVLGVFKESFGRFEVRSGEVVNIGLLKLIYVGTATGGTQTIHLAVGEIPEYHMNKFREMYPNLAAQMNTRLLEVPIPKLSDQEMVKYCQHVTDVNASHRLPTHPACQRGHDGNVRRLDAMDPGRPALMQ